MDSLFDGFNLPNDAAYGNIFSQQVDVTPNINTIETNLVKRSMVVFFVIDISGSMRKNRIQAVNEAMRQLVPELKKRAQANTNAEIKIAMLLFHNKAFWKTPQDGPVSVTDFTYTPIEDKDLGTATMFSMAFDELNKKMSRSEFLKASAGAYTPLVVLMTDGDISDLGLYQEKLEELKKNSWFRYATKAAVGIGEKAEGAECRKLLTEFTSDEDMIFYTKNSHALIRYIELVTLTGVDFVTRQGSVQNSGNAITPSSGRNFGSLVSPPGNGMNQGQNFGAGNNLNPFSISTGAGVSGLAGSQGDNLIAGSGSGFAMPGTGENPKIPGLEDLLAVDDLPTFSDDL